MTFAVNAARTIPTRLHDVLASRSNAQARHNTVVETIGGGLESEVCSIYQPCEEMLGHLCSHCISRTVGEVSAKAEIGVGWYS